MNIEKLPNKNRTSYDFDVFGKTHEIQTDVCKFWRVTYKNVVYIRESRLYHNTTTPVYYWSIENVGQNNELYDIQNELENMFHRTIRKDKLINVNKR